MNFELPPLPYAKDALEPYLSAETLELHHDVHHQGYLDKLAAALEGRPEAHKSLFELVTTSTGDLFNNAAQVWNHAFYFDSMKPDGGREPGRALREPIEASFGSFKAFREAFLAAATRQFGSGWTWLVVLPGGELRVLNTPDAESPLQLGLSPLLALDVWEHAYYLDYRNERGRYAEDFLDHLAHWDFAAENLRRARAAGGGVEL